jgi:MFS family permease
MQRLARHPAFRLLAAGYITSVFGDRALFVVLGIWTLDLTGSSAAGGLAFAFLGLAGLLAPLAGLIADRYPRRTVLIANDLATGAVVLALLAVNDRSDVWIVYGVALLYGFSNQVGAAARGGLVAGLVPEDLLAPANGVIESARSGVRIVAPAVGAALYVAVGGPAVVVLDTCTFLLSAACLAGLRVPDIATRGGRVTFAELGAGFRHLFGTPSLRRLQLAIVLGAAGVGSAEVIPFSVVHDGLGDSSALLGVLSAGHGAGAIAGGIGAGILAGRLGEERVQALALLIGAVGMAVFAIPNAAAALLASVMFGICLASVMVAYFTMVAKRTPDALRGRALAAAETIASTPYLSGIAVAAFAVSQVDYRLVTLVGALALSLSALLTYRAERSAALTPAVQPA